MGYTKLALFIVGLLLTVAAAWVFLTQTPFADDIPAGVALAIILLLVGLGIMVSANAIDDSFVRRRVVHDSDPYTGSRGTRTTVYDDPDRGATYREPVTGETITEERRY